MKHNQPTKSDSGGLRISDGFADRSICPICFAPVKRLSLVWPVFRCRNCHRRLIICGTWRTTAMTTLTLVILSAIYLFSDSSPELLISLIALFVVGSTLWLHLFGRPRLKGWIGYASRARLAAERSAYQSEEKALITNK